MSYKTDLKFLSEISENFARLCQTFLLRSPLLKFLSNFSMYSSIKHLSQKFFHELLQKLFRQFLLKIRIPSEYFPIFSSWILPQVPLENLQGLLLKFLQKVLIRILLENLAWMSSQDSFPRGISWRILRGIYKGTRGKLPKESLEEFPVESIRQLWKTFMLPKFSQDRSRGIFFQRFHHRFLGYLPEFLLTTLQGFVVGLVNWALKTYQQIWYMPEKGNIPHCTLQSFPYVLFQVFVL